MPSFKDEEGREWRVRVDVGAIQRVLDLKTEPQINLGDIGQAADNMVRFSNDPVLLVNVLYLICEEQTKTRSVSDTDFGGLFLGDVLFDATMALEEAVTAFFPPAKRSLLLQLRKKLARFRETGETLVLEKLEDKELEARLLQTMRMLMETKINESLAPSNSPTSLAE